LGGGYSIVARARIDAEHGVALSGGVELRDRRVVGRREVVMPARGDVAVRFQNQTSLRDRDLGHRGA
jgi:hypothetical protein